MPNIGTLVAHLSLNTGTFQRAMSGATRRMGGFSGLVAKAGLVGAGGVAALGLGATKMAVDFESSFAGVRKTVDATEAQFAELSKGFRGMAKEIPVNVNELNRIGEAAGQLGIKQENILGFTRVMADLGVTTNMSSDEAATALARLANITQLPQDQFENMGSTIVELGNNMATTEAEIVNMSLRLAAAGDIVGLTQAETLSFAAALSSVGIRAEAGGTAISRVFVDIANAAASGGDQLDLFAKVAGLSSTEFTKAFEEDAAGAIVTFIEGLGGITKSGGNVFPVLEALGLSNVRVQRALLSAAGAGDTFRESLALGSKAWDENTALAAEAAQRYETTASQMRIFMNVVQDVAISIGSALLPTLSDLAQKGAEALQGVDFEAFAVTVGVAVENIITFIGSIPWSEMVDGIQTVVGFLKDNAIPILAAFGVAGTAAFIGMLPAITAWATGAITAAVATAIAFAPITLAVVAMGVAVALLRKAWETNFGGIRDFTADVLRGMTERIESFITGFADKWNTIARLINRFSNFDLPTMERVTINVLRNIADEAVNTGVEFEEMGEAIDGSISGTTEVLATVGDAAAVAGLDVQQLVQDFGDLGAETGKAADDMEDMERAIDAILGMPLVGETAVDDALFNMGQEAKRLELQLIRMGGQSEGALQGLKEESKRLELQLIRMGGRGAEGTDPIKEALKRVRADLRALRLEAELEGDPLTETKEALRQLRDDMRATRLEAQIQFDPLKRTLERVAKPIQEIAWGDALDQVLQLRPMTLEDVGAIAESFGLIADEIPLIGNFNFNDMTATQTDMLSIADSSGKLLANLKALSELKGFSIGPGGAITLGELPEVEVAGVRSVEPTTSIGGDRTDNFFFDGDEESGADQRDRWANDPVLHRDTGRRETHDG